MMSKVTNWIKGHQVAAFFLLTYLLTWPGLFLIYFIFPGNLVVEFISGPLTVYSPALVALLIAGIAEPLPKHKKSPKRWIVFFGVWVISATILVLYGWKIQKLELAVNIFANSIIALLPAWMLSNVYGRSPGIRKQFLTLLKPRGPAYWYLVIFLMFPGVPILAMGVTRLTGGQAHFYLAGLPFQEIAVLLVLEFLRGFLLTGGINEESGWRGFVLPRLQSRYPVIISAGIVIILIIVVSVVLICH